MGCKQTRFRSAAAKNDVCVHSYGQGLAHSIPGRPAGKDKALALSHIKRPIVHLARGRGCLGGAHPGFGRAHPVRAPGGVCTGSLGWTGLAPLKSCSKPSQIPEVTCKCQECLWQNWYNLNTKYTMYPWSLLANLFTGGGGEPVHPGYGRVEAPQQCMVLSECIPWPWPMTLVFRADPDIIQVDPWPKFGDPRNISFAFTTLKPISVRALKQKIKNKKQTLTKFKGRALHWPNWFLLQGEPRHHPGRPRPKMGDRGTIAIGLLLWH